jgi:hypothetical protein
MSKYSAALLHILFVVLSALTAALDHGLNPATIVQLAILTIGAVIVYFVPLLDSKLSGILKVGASALTAALSVLAPLLLQGHITSAQWITIVLAALGALGVGVGVSARLDGPGSLSNVIVNTHAIPAGPPTVSSEPSPTYVPPTAAVPPVSS